MLRKVDNQEVTLEHNTCLDGRAQSRGQMASRAGVGEMTRAILSVRLQFIHTSGKTMS